MAERTRRLLPETRPEPTVEPDKSVSVNPPSTPDLNLPFAGRIKFFVKEWQKITNDPWILQTVEGYKLELFQEPVQISVPNPIAFSDSEKELIQDEINQMLEKGAICEVHQSQCRFLSNLFLVAKKGGGQRPVINLRNLNKYVQYHHFKMEGIHMLKDMINPKDWACKDRSKRCILHSANKSKLPAISLLPMGGSLLPISVPRIWSGECPKSLHKAYEASDLLPSQTRRAYDSLSGRYAFSKSESRRSSTGLGPSTENLSRFRTGGKSYKIRTNPCQADRISRVSDRLDRDDTLSTKKQNLENFGSVSQNSLPGSNNSARPGKLTREVHRLDTGILSSPLHYRLLQKENTPH